MYIAVSFTFFKPLLGDQNWQDIGWKDRCRNCGSLGALYYINITLFYSKKKNNNNNNYNWEMNPKTETEFPYK